MRLRFLIISCLVTILSSNLKANSFSSAEDTTVYMLADKMPLFGKSKADIMNYILSTIKLPEDVLNDVNTKKKGLYAQFVVEKNGSLSNITISRSTHPSLNVAVTQLLRDMPRWSPGKQNNVPVRVLTGIPVDFKSQQRTVITTTTVRSLSSETPTSVTTSSNNTTTTFASSAKKTTNTGVLKRSISNNITPKKNSNKAVAYHHPFVKKQVKIVTTSPYQPFVN